MAQITDHTTLSAAIKGWAYDADEITAGEIDEIIQLAEAEMQDRVRVREMIVRNGPPDKGQGLGMLLLLTKAVSNRVLTPDSNGEVALPADFLGFQRVTWDGSPKRNLLQRTEEELHDEYPNDRAGRPSLYAVTGETLVVRPIDQTALKADYYARWTGITSTNATGVMLTAHVDLYMWACRKMLAVFEDDIPDMQKYEALFSDAVTRKNDTATGEQYGRTASRGRGPRP